MKFFLLNLKIFIKDTLTGAYHRFCLKNDDVRSTVARYAYPVRVQIAM
jgi:hypothetical protein